MNLKLSLVYGVGYGVWCGVGRGVLLGGVTSYRAGDDTHVLGVLLEPVVHVFTHGKQVV